MKYRQWLEEWLTRCASPAVARTTYRKYAQIVELHIAPALGDRDLNELNPDIYWNFVAMLATSGNCRTGEGLAANTVGLVLSVLKSSVRAANRLGLKNARDAEHIRRPASAERPVRCFSASEQKAIEKACLCDRRPKMLGIVICLYTGLRIGELLALDWTDVDLEKGVLSVTKSCHYEKISANECARIVDRPKTPGSTRLIPLPARLVPHLRDAFRRRDSDAVVAHNGKPVNTRSYQYSFELLLKRLGIPRRGFHALRHTFATRAAEAGTDAKTIAELLGHKNATVALNRYVHSLFEHKRDAMDRLGEFCAL